MKSRKSDSRRFAQNPAGTITDDDVRGCRLFKKTNDKIGDSLIEQKTSCQIMCLPSYMVVVLIALGCERRWMPKRLTFFKKRSGIVKKY